MSGVVRDGAGLPQANAAVLVRSVGAFSNTWAATTDVAGRYATPNVFVGELLVSVKNPLAKVLGLASGRLLAEGDQVPLDVFIDGRTVNPNNDPARPQWPSLHFEANVVRGLDNTLPHPIHLPPLLMGQAKVVGGDTDVILTIPGIDGFQMKVKANSVTFPDGRSAQGLTGFAMTIFAFCHR